MDYLDQLRARLEQCREIAKKAPHPFVRWLYEREIPGLKEKIAEEEKCLWHESKTAP